MAVTKHPTKEGWWVLDIRNGKKGPRDRIPFPGTWDEAQTEYHRLKQKTAKIVSHTTRIGELVGDFVNWYKLEKAPDTIKDFWYAWKRLEPHFGSLRFADLTTTDIDRYKGKRLDDTYLPGKPRKNRNNDSKEEQHRRRPISKRTITRELAYFSSMCKWAKENGYTTQDIIVRGFPKKQTKAPIQTTQTFEEMQRIVDQCEESIHYKDDRRGLVLLMYDAGLRKKEARLIEAERVELPPSPVIISETLPLYYGYIKVTRKGDKEQMLPILTERLYNELKKRKEKTRKGYLYINPFTEKPYLDIRTGLKNAAEKAGVTKRITNHLLRHNFVTHLHEGGADLKTIQGLVGHSQIQTTLDIYTHLDDLKLARMAGGFANRIDTYGKPKKGGQKKEEKD